MTAIFSAQEAARWTRGTWAVDAPAHIVGVSHDTRTLRKDDLYVALIGVRCDGHDFVGEAFAKGACGAVVSGGWRPVAPPPGPVLKTDDTGAAVTDYRPRHPR